MSFSTVSSPFIPLLLACGALIGWGLQRVTSLRPAVAAKVLLLWNALRGLICYNNNSGLFCLAALSWINVQKLSIDYMQCGARNAVALQDEATLTRA